MSADRAPTAPPANAVRAPREARTAILLHVGAGDPGRAVAWTLRPGELACSVTVLRQITPSRSCAPDSAVSTASACWTTTRRHESCDITDWQRLMQPLTELVGLDPSHVIEATGDAWTVTMSTVRWDERAGHLATQAYSLAWDTSDGPVHPPESDAALVAFGQACHV